jgi:hypothetical protein
MICEYCGAKMAHRSHARYQSINASQSLKRLLLLCSVTTKLTLLVARRSAASCQSIRGKPFSEDALHWGPAKLIADVRPLYDENCDNVFSAVHSERIYGVFKGERGLLKNTILHTHTKAIPRGRVVNHNMRIASTRQSFVINLIQSTQASAPCETFVRGSTRPLSRSSSRLSGILWMTRTTSRPFKSICDNSPETLKNLLQWRVTCKSSKTALTNLSKRTAC